MTTYHAQQTRREISQLRDLQKHVIGVDKRILIEQRIRKMEQQLQENEKNRPGRRPRLSTRLKYLIALIIHQTPAGGKEAARDA